jgi:hypothetical protein
MRQYFAFTELKRTSISSYDTQEIESLVDILFRYSEAKLKHLYKDKFVNSDLMVGLIQELRNTVVEFRFLKQAEIIIDENNPE